MRMVPGTSLDDLTSYIKMADLAKQAFAANNFDLSVELYERTICEKGRSVDLYLGLGDSYARGGHLQKAFESYTQACRLGKVNPDNLNQLVAALVDITRDTLSQPVEASCGDKTEDVFVCGFCLHLWYDPVTTSCGHTFCRGCIERNESRSCKQCKTPNKHALISPQKTNVLLSQTVEKWFKDGVIAAKLKHEGNALFERRRFEEAVDAFSKALEYGK